MLQMKCDDHEQPMQMRELCSEAEEIKHASMMAENTAAAHREEAATLREALDIRAREITSQAGHDISSRLLFSLAQVQPSCLQTGWGTLRFCSA